MVVTLAHPLLDQILPLTKIGLNELIGMDPKAAGSQIACHALVVFFQVEKNLTQAIRCRDRQRCTTISIKIPVPNPTKCSSELPMRDQLDNKYYSHRANRDLPPHSGRQDWESLF
jgi:hypothetical protein